jgi:hypothetical protein
MDDTRSSSSFKAVSTPWARSSGAAAAAGEAVPSKGLILPAAKLSEVRVPETTPMSAAAVNLAKAGYTEREFYADGTANRYRGAVSGSEQIAQRIDWNWPYRTRVLVRAPKTYFNGTLVVEWGSSTTS